MASVMGKFKQPGSRARESSALDMVECGRRCAVPGQHVSFLMAASCMHA